MARGTTTNLPREAILAAGAFTALGTGAIYMWSILINLSWKNSAVRHPKCP